MALAEWFGWLERCPIIEGLQVRFPVRDYTWLVGLIPGQLQSLVQVHIIPGRGAFRRQPIDASLTLMFLSLCSLSSSLLKAMKKCPWVKI